MKVRERILRQARQKFLQEGFYKVSMDELVREAQTSKSSLYNHFASKDELVEAVLERLNEEINTHLEEILANEALAFKGKLLAISQFTEQLLSETSALFLRDLEVHTPELWAHYQRNREARIDKYYRALFEKGVREGLLRNDIDMRLILAAYFSLTEIPLRFDKVRQLSMPNKEAYEAINDIFLNGLKAGK